jgi:hypothetical protein
MCVMTVRYLGRVGAESCRGPMLMSMYPPAFVVGVALLVAPRLATCACYAAVASAPLHVPCDVFLTEQVGPLATRQLKRHNIGRSTQVTHTTHTQTTTSRLSAQLTVRAPTRCRHRRTQASKAIAAVSLRLAKGGQFSNDEVDANWETEKVIHSGWLVKQVMSCGERASCRAMVIRHVPHIAP